MSESPSCTTPVSARPISPSVLDQFNQNYDEDSLELGVVSSPGSKRCPTLKDYSEKIKKLQQENFQLRVRIYLNEQKCGVKTSSSDLAVLYSHLPHLQNQTGGANNGNVFPSHSTAQSSLSISSGLTLESLNNELDRVKSDRNEMEEKLRMYEEDLESKNQQIAHLTSQNEQLAEKQKETVEELNTAASAIQKLRENQQSTSKVTDEEVDKLACFAFEQDDIDVINHEWEAKLSDKNKDISRLENELLLANHKLESSDLTIKSLKSDLRSEKATHENKILEMTACLKEMGAKCHKLEQQNLKLQRKLADKTKENLDRIALNPNADKLSAIHQLVGLLQSRMKELTDFVEALLCFESKKVVSLTGFTNENRENLVKSVEQARLFGENLDKMFEKDSITESHLKSFGNVYAKEYQRGNNNNHSSESVLAPLHHYQQPHCSTVAARTYSSSCSPLERIRLKSDGVQCELLEPSLKNSLESANAYINKLKHDINILERINVQLGQEKADLQSQVRTLESSMNILKMTNHVSRYGNTEVGTSKMKEENRQLVKRLTVTEEALRNLHVEHAKMVGELKTLRNSYQKSSKALAGSTVVDSTRPSDSTSPDLGIDSGHDGAANSDDSNANNCKEENRILRTTNRELALKLKQTRQALDITLEKLNSTTKEKEQVEKAICRQLHKTHTILRQAKRSVEKFTNSQCQENIMPNT